MKISKYPIAYLLLKLLLLQLLHFNLWKFSAKLAYLAPKEAISLAEGMPNEATFPFQKITVSLNDGSEFCLQGRELGAALQYIPTQGYPPLVQTMKDFTKYIHDPPNWENTEVMMTNGSQDGISKSIEMCLQEGDPVLVQNPLYSGTEVVVSN